MAGPLTVYELQNLQHAARLLEKKDVEGYAEVATKFGDDMAKGMLVMVLRCRNGSLQDPGADARVPKAVKQILRDNGLLDDRKAQEDRKAALDDVAKRAAQYMKEQGEQPAIVPKVAIHESSGSVEELLEELKREKRERDRMEMENESTKSPE